MGYSQFKSVVLGRARKKVGRRYHKMVLFLSDEDHFVFKKKANHKERIEHFLHLLNELYGVFSAENSYDHTNTIRNCFLHSTCDCPMRDASDLSHIASIKNDKTAILKALLDDIDEFSYLVCEKVL